MKLNHTAFGFAALLACQISLAQYGTPESLKAEMNQGDDLTFAKDATDLGANSGLSNAVFKPGRQGEGRLPALVILPTCGGISQHIRVWTEEALKRGHVVLAMDGLRGLKSDCGSPSKISNGRLVKDTLDAVAHLAAMPDVDRQRISVLGFSKGAIVATWLASTNVVNTLRPGTPPVAGVVAAYGLCGLGPTRGRPQGITILQPDTDRPLLALLGGRDNETSPASCLELMPKLKEKGAPVQWHLYPEATHAWDKKEQDGFSKLDFKNERVTYQYDATITQDSIQRTFDFLAQHGGK
jgi:dienelactone hydrolase